MKIKQYALCTLARQKMGSYTIQDCIKFKEEKGIFPFSDNPGENDEWIYNFYVEYFKKFKSGLADNAFFTPLSYASDIKRIYNNYFGINTPQNKESILDAFCGIGNLTLGYYDNVEAFDINTEFLEVCEYKNNKNNERIKNNILTPLRYETAQFNAFNFDYDTRKFSVNKLGKTYNCIISNPPFGKYRGGIIDKAVIEFFEKHLNKDGILIVILPNNFYEKYEKFMSGFELLRTGGEVNFDYTGISAKIFVFKKI